MEVRNGLVVAHGRGKPSALFFGSKYKGVLVGFMACIQWLNKAVVLQQCLGVC